MSMRKQGLFETGAMVKIGMLWPRHGLMLLNFPLDLSHLFEDRF